MPVRALQLRHPYHRVGIHLDVPLGHRQGRVPG
jgi:hypothetical protein